MNPSPASIASMSKLNASPTFDLYFKLFIFTRLGSDTYTVTGLPILFVPFLRISISCGPIDSGVYVI
jgi:hypothetical protein